MSDLHPAFRPAANAIVAVASRFNLRPRVTSTFRDPKLQQILWERRQRTINGTLRPGEPAQNLPVARPGTSRHEVGAAIDMVTDVPGAQAWLGGVWRSWGGFWTASDPVHFGDVG